MLTTILSTFVTFAVVVSAGGSIDNSAEANAVMSSASTLGDGQYVIENVATGQVLSFSREGGTTNFYPNDSGDSVQVQFADGAARLSGGNNKCVSAQWSYDTEGGVDHAAVSYACAVGQGEKTGTDTLEKTKQWWYLVPVDDGSVSSGGGGDDNNNDDDSGDDDSQNDETASPQVMLAAQPSKQSSSSSSASDSNDNNDSPQYLSHDKGYYEYEGSTIPLDKVDTSKVNKYDRASWICRHPGWWLARHPDYVSAGHPECASDLKAYRAANKRFVRRSTSHSEMAKNMMKRGSSNAYYIVAQDHLQDMATRAVGSQAIQTYGGYTSTILSLWDKTDQSQMWTVTSA
ncbi:hypothetical protein OIO90_003252 [Microbotryomycetes sp. JL221]|nr:hypothetical protein OIO90_003252 [Microbotryomycetes sp. JL221]